jgi:hypothetical protein
MSDFDHKLRAARERVKTPDPSSKTVEHVAGVTLDDFHAYMPNHSYIYAPSGEMWPATSVDARIAPITTSDNASKSKQVKASTWLDQNKSIEQMTWAPGQPMLIRGRLVSEGGWIERKGVTCFNLYRPPQIKLGNPQQAQRWIEHVRKVFPENADRVVGWLAHRVQHPEDKINHALVLGGNQGIGKDTLLEPVKRAIGPWNFSEVSPAQIMGRFNGFLKSVILRVSEARDLGDVLKYLSNLDALSSVRKERPIAPGVIQQLMKRWPIDVAVACEKRNAEFVAELDGTQLDRQAETAA